MWPKLESFFLLQEQLRYLAWLTWHRYRIKIRTESETQKFF